MSRRPEADFVRENARTEGAGIPDATLLETGDFPVAELAKLALREGQRTKSLYRAHRWFARRLGSQFRALVLGATLSSRAAESFWEIYYSDKQVAEDLIVLDPFLGGGTTLVEASRLGANVVGVDIDPVPATIARFHLEASAVPDLKPSLENLLDTVGADIQQYHMTFDEDGVEREVLYHFWVQITNCVSCNAEVEVHPHFQLARNKGDNVQWAFCRHCHEVQELPLDRKILVCEMCQHRTTIRAGTLRNGKIFCLKCRSGESLAKNSQRRGGPPRWRLFAKQFLVRHGPGPRQVDRVYEKATCADWKRYDAARKRFQKLFDSGNAVVPTRKIPREGRRDSRPILHGFERYHQLFNPRQLLHLHALANQLNAMEESPKRRALAIAFSEHLTTNNMLVGYAFGYGRTSPLFSIHAYRHITRPVEVNPWLVRIGRGTYPNAVLKVQRAVESARKPKDLMRDGTKRLGEVPVGGAGAIMNSLGEAPNASTITARSAEDLRGLPDNSVDLVLTDPPYGDNISYSELSDFYLAWQQVLNVAPGRYREPTVPAPIKDNLAAEGRTEEALDPYEAGLASAFQEANRALKPSGLLVFSFHHVHGGTWEALARAVYQGGFTIENVLPLRGEGRGGLHTHPGTIKWDAVLVSRPVLQASRSPTDLYVPVNALPQVRERVTEWTRRLGDPTLEFRRPDQINLARAMLMQAAGPRSSNSLPLGEVLQKIDETYFKEG